MQRYASFHRVPGDPPRFFAYVLNGLIAAAVTAGIGLLFHPGNPDPLAAGDVAPILLSCVMCTALALCCDDWVADTMPPRWLRLAEGAGCAVAVVLGMALIVVYLPEALKITSDKLVGLTLVMLFAFPSALALMIGGCVPHIYRSARRAATARRDEASRLLTPVLPAPQPSTTGACRSALPRRAGRVLASTTSTQLRSVKASGQSSPALPTELILNDAKATATLGQARIFATLINKKRRRNCRMANTTTLRAIAALPNRKKATQIDGATQAVIW
jgi:hypothetical protein